MKIHTIDLSFRGLSESIAAFLIETPGELALVETGPSSTVENLETGILNLGFDPEAIQKVLLTHVHLDHAGAAGWWAAKGAQVYVHERGAPHLIDPGKLIAGARAVYGDEMETLWGEIKPIPESQVTALTEGDTVDVGGAQFQVWDTPGHARHHVVFLTDGIAFVGDVAGVRLPGQSFISPTTAPSQYELDPYIASITRLSEANLDRLYLTHFGMIEDVVPHLQRYEAILRQSTELVGNKVKEEHSREEIVEAFSDFNRARAESEFVEDIIWQCYENANPSEMCADGIALYWKRLLG